MIGFVEPTSTKKGRKKKAFEREIGIKIMEKKTWDKKHKHKFQTKTIIIECKEKKGNLLFSNGNKCNINWE